MMTEEAQKLANLIYVVIQGCPWPVAQLALAMSVLQYEDREKVRKKAANEPEE